MRASRAVASVVLGGCAAFVALVVHAQPETGEAAPRVALTWHAPPGCPDEGAVRAGLLALLAGSQAPVTVRADVVRAGDSWRVVVAMNGGERRLEASSCRAIAEATELIVAMAVDPVRAAANRKSLAATDAGGAVAFDDAGGAGGGRSDAAVLGAPPLADAGLETAVVGDASAPLVPLALMVPATTDADASAPPVPPAAVVAPSPAGPRSTVVAVSAAGALDIGTLPEPAVGPAIAFAWTPRRFRFELAGGYFFPDSTPAAAKTGAIERFTMLTGSLRGCYVATPWRFDLGGCGVVEVASVHGQGWGILFPTRGSSGWVAPGVGLFGAFRVARSFAIVARADALIPTRRPDFQVDQVTLHYPGTVTGRLGIGAELRF